MVFIKPFIGAAALLSGFATALPRPDSAVGGEVAVSAPNGTPITDTAELASQTAAEAAAASSTSSSESSGGYGSSGYGSSSSYGSGSEGYGSESSSSDCGYAGCGDSSSTLESTSIDESTSTFSTSTAESTMVYSMPSYGSGGYNWQNSGYDDCVQQCIASHGAPPATYTPPTSTYGGEGSTGTGSTITVIVAPTAGVFRYMPAFVNASVGTTIEFMWGADNHTVTKSSELLPCNHSAEEPSFISGIQTKGFTFTQVVNDTAPTYFYCGVPTHCQKGMFGIINPPSNFGAPTSVSGMMQGMMDSNPSLEAYASYSANVTSGKPGSNWGSSISLENMPAWSHELVAENVLYTRNLLAMNPEFVKEDGSIDMATFGSMPLSIPNDYGSSINAAASGPSVAGAASDNGSTDSGSSTTDSSSTAAPSQAGSNGALSVTSSKMLVAAMALVATVFAL